MQFRSLFLAALAACVSGLGAFAAPSEARGLEPNWAAPRARAPLAQAQARLLSLRDVIEIVRGRYGGELISARLDDRGARPVYVLRWRFPNDQIDDIRVDAVSGQVFR